MLRSTAIATAGALALAIAVPATSGAVTYPPPTNPGQVKGKPKGPFKTLRVGKGRQFKFHKIQAAVGKAKPGDTIRIANGTYKESVKIAGQGKRFIKLIGNPADPSKVVLEGSGKLQNGIFVNGADGVGMQGIKARRYKANGFFATNVTGYVMDRLIAELPGTYGLYAFNAKGGSMTNSLSYLAADGGYYVGQTPEQTKPLRTIIKNVVAWGNVTGYTGTNSRYVTLTKSKFFNNAVGVVPNTLDSEKFPPDEQNVFADNDVFWNNFDVYAKSNTQYKPNRGDDFIYPPGLGMILLSGRENRFENNRIYGNWLSGLTAVQNVFLKATDAVDMIDNSFTGNAFGLNGTDKNGRDIVYSGNGKGNCWSGNTGVETIVPADPATMPGCPFSGSNTSNGDNGAFDIMLKAGVQGQYRDVWVQTTHAFNDELDPLVDWESGKTYGPTKLP